MTKRQGQVLNGCGGEGTSAAGGTIPFQGHRTCAEWDLSPVRVIQEAVAHYYSLSLEDLLSGKRERKFSRPRQVAMYLAAELTGQPGTEIGRRFNRDHTTVIHARRQIAKLLRSEPMLAHDVRLLREWLTEQPDFPQKPAETPDFALAQTGPARIVNSETRRDGNPNRASDQQCNVAEGHCHGC